MPVDAPVVTGYYRYTDIWFEWHKVLPNSEDGFPLKAFLAHDSFVHPDHPLHVQGVSGVQLYIGTLPTGESRLMFSSAQVDYARYWLHAMQLTKEIIPLPYSDCLLTEGDLRSISPVVYPNGGSLRAAIKTISKNNKRLGGTSPSLSHRRIVFERVRNYWAQKDGAWCAMDFESWERDHKLITEFGWSSIYWKDGKEVEECGHWIIDEAKRYRNSTYVVDHRDNYNFGKSEIIKKSTLKQRISDLFAGLSQHGPLFLVFHDNTQDIKYLKSSIVDAPLDGLSYILPESIPKQGMFVVDTSDLFGALLGEPSNRRALGKMCDFLQIQTNYLHNGGNDAYYTLQAMKSMAEGDPVDNQREKRWPNRTTTGGLQVKLEAWQEDSDYSDEEGIIPPTK